MRLRNGRSRLWLAISVLPVLIAVACGGGSDGTAAGDGQGEQETWEPTRDVTMTVPFGAGGGTDTMARAIADGLESVRPGLEIAVVNREGGSGSQGYAHAWQQQGDPHELLAVESTVVTVPLLTEVPFGWSDFTPIGQVSDHVAMIAAQSGEYDGQSDLIDSAANEPVTMSVSGGPLGLQAMSVSFLQLNTGAQFREPNFGTGSEAINTLVAGDVDAAIASPEHAAPFIQDGELEGLAVLTDERIPFGVLEQVPTAKEQGVDVVFTGIRGLFAAPEITDAQRQYWVDAFNDWTDSPSYEKYIENTQSVANAAGPKQFIENIEQFEEKAQQAAKNMD